MVQLIVSPSWSDLYRLLKDPSITIGLAGPPGVGKTSFAYYLGKMTRKKYIGKIQFHSELSPAEIMGMHVPAEQGFRWEPGPGDLAYSKGGLLILDEIDQASGPTKTYCYGLLDRGPGGTISYVGREFKQEEGYQPIATMNGDPTDGSLPDALLDRFDAWFFMTRPAETLIKMLDEDLQEMCIASYDSAKDPMAGPAFTYRMMLGYQKLRRVLPMDQALLGACYGNQVLARSLVEVFSLSDMDDEEELAENDYAEEAE